MNQKEPITMLESDLMDWLPLDPKQAIPLHYLATVMNAKRITIAFLLLSIQAKGVPIAIQVTNDHYGFYILTS
ncbi:hypothetical protein [Enterococcus wangshanyuanii]|uniref:Uncharacterized protein n=1 Tax=Enterococcus wangshanyuanii TaxID=2005703 RepID=A0ABQ1NEH2_9ENTE|nr:hypothetical protein [Enterococcus wangshanyuanii]GGC74592.1 hypothetical protein GCM10011573_00110 [Enterococcus wangshanyuanii]